MSVHTQFFLSAVSRNKLEEAQALLDQGADVHAEDDEAIKRAARNGDEEMVSLLIKNKADFTANEGYALRIAAKNGFTEVVRVLLNHGADPLTNNHQALRYSAEAGQKDATNLILAHGDYENKHKSMALLALCSIGETDRAEALLKQGTNTSEIYPYALAWAFDNKHPLTAQTLLKHSKTKDIEGFLKTHTTAKKRVILEEELQRRKSKVASKLKKSEPEIEP